MICLRESHKHDLTPFNGLLSWLKGMDVNNPTHQRIELETIGMVCRFSVNVFAALFVIGAVLAYVVSLDHSSLWAWTWYAIMGTVALLRWRLHYTFLKQPRTVNDVSRWRVIVIGGGAITGFLWSIPATMLLPSSLEVQLFLCACLMGVVASASGVLAPLRNAFVWFVAPLILPTALVQFAQGANHVYIGAGLLIYMIALLAVASRYHHDTARMLSLAFDNEELAARLAEENRRVAQANQDLQQQIEERQRIEATLKSAKAEADQANRAKSQFLANMSHEVRTPLNVVLGMTELLKRTSLDGAQNKYADSAHRAGTRLLAIIDDLLDLARVEAGQMRFRDHQFAPREWLADTVEALRPQATKKSLGLSHHVADNTPSYVLGDSDRLRQVLTNLLANAIKFTDAGEIRIAIDIHYPAYQVPQLRVSVSDSGIGIAEHARRNLFQPFSQVDDSATRRFGGAGLGLAISKQIISAMEGQIGVESEIDRGSTFWFCIPLRVVEPESNSYSQASPQLDVQLNAKILVAEDTEANRELVEAVLRLAGCTVESVASGSEAVQKMFAHRYDAMIVDWHMPEMDGLSVIRQLREREAKENLPRLTVIALTASAMPGDRETCLQAGADDYLTKPFAYDELINLLKRRLPQRAANGQ